MERLSTKFCAVFILTVVFAPSACALPTHHGDIVRRERMPAAASVTLSENLLTGGTHDSHSEGVSAPVVFEVSNRLQVLRVDATSNSTEVVNFQSLRYWLDEKFVSHTVSVVDLGSADAESGVAFECVPQPEPTSRIRLGGHEIHEAFKYALSSHVISLGSRWSGLRSIASAVVARSYCTALGVA